MKMLNYYELKTLEILSGHRGEQNPISGKRIAELIGLRGRRDGLEGADMRAIIHNLRVQGWPVCAGLAGYYFANTYEELSKFIVSLEKRIKSQKEAKDGLNRAFEKIGKMVSLEELKLEEEKKMAQSGMFG